MTRKNPIPQGLNPPDEILAYMHSHHFKNRHPSIGSTAGMIMTYYELCIKQEQGDKQ
jgi:hypothetical protein